LSVPSRPDAFSRALLDETEVDALDPVVARINPQTVAESDSNGW